MHLCSRLAILALLFILAACSQRQLVLPADQAVTEPSPTAAISAAAPTVAQPEPTKTKVLPTPTVQVTQTPEQPGIAYPVPRPLTGQAPWIMFPCQQAEAGSLPAVANGNGTGCIPFSLPTGIPDRAWIAIAPEHGSYVAFRVKINPPKKPSAQNAAYRLQANGLDDQLWIVKLPENRIIRKITQIDGGGWERIQKMWPNSDSSGANDVPLPLAVFLDPGAYRWSSDGRFLAYTAVDKDGVDLFVYDSLNDTIRRMSRGRQGAFLWSWSPEGKWIIYRDMSRCRLEKGVCQLERGLHYYAVAFPKPEYQFEDNFPASDVDWVAKDSYILQDVPAQGQLSSRLVQVNLSTGIATPLYEQPFSSYTYVPKTYVSRKQMYLLNLPADPANDRVTGVYNLYPPREVDWLRPFLTGKYGDYTIQWERTLEQFILSKDVTSDASVDLSGNALVQKDVLLVPVSLTDPVRLGVLSTAELYLSPDGVWFTTRLSTGKWALYNKQGTQIRELGPASPTVLNPVQWKKDSSGFFFFGFQEGCASTTGCIYRFDQVPSWSAVKIAELKDSAGVYQVIEP